jgi:hypothetical protein
VVVSEFSIREHRNVRIAPIGEFTQIQRTGHGFLSGDGSQLVSSMLNACDIEQSRSLIITDTFLHECLTGHDNYEISSHVAMCAFEKHPEISVVAYTKRIIADAGYRGHNAPPEYRFKVYVAGQRRGMTEAIKRLMRRRPAIEPVIGHTKSDHRMDRNYLAGTQGDAANAVLAAAGYNFRRILAWLALLLSAIPTVTLGGAKINAKPTQA